MKKFLLETAKIVGTVTEKSWSQIHFFSPADEDKQRLRGELLAVLSLSGLEEGIESVAAGREIIARLHEEYYGNLEGELFERLEAAVAKVVAEVASGSEVKIEIGAAVVAQGVLYLAVAGEGQAILQRDSQMGMILKGNKKVATASGFLKDGDLFLLGTSAFFQSVAAGVLKAALATGSPAEVVETLAPIVHGHPDSGAEAALICKVKEKKPTPALFPEETPAPAAAPSGPLTKPTSGLKGGVKASLLLLKSKTKRQWGYLSLRFQNFFKKRTVYLKQERRIGVEKKERSKKTVFSVVLILLFLLGVSVVLGARQRRRSGVESKAVSLLEEAKQKKEEGEALLELNPSRSRGLLLAARDLVQAIETEGYQSSEFEAFKIDLDQILKEVLKEHQVEASLFFDLELIKQGAWGDDVALSGGKAFILDKNKQSLYELDLTDKKSALLAAGKSLADASHVAAFFPNIFVLTEQGILQINRTTKKETLIVEFDEDWGEIIDFQAFSANLYLLSQEGAVWQYPAAETGFGSRRSWLKDGVTPDFYEAVAMTIDGSIWVAENDGTVLKFTRGRSDAFGAAGLEATLNPASFYTDDEADNLYLLDKSHSQVVVLAKSGEYQATYFENKIANSEGILVLEEEGKILLLVGGKLYEVETK